MHRVVYFTYRTTVIGIFLAFTGIRSNCTEYLVSGPNGVDDKKITASSYITGGEPWIGRINSTDGYGFYGAWITTARREDFYIQVEFRTTNEVVGVVTREPPQLSYWVTIYTVSYSSDGQTWTNVMDGEFTGNDGSRLEPVVNLFGFSIFARYIRINPTSYRTYPAMRFDILGCSSDTKLSGCAVNGVQYTDSLVDGPGGVTDYQITSSSHAGSGFEPWTGRMTYASDDINSGWRAGSTFNQYLQIDFGRFVEVACIILHPQTRYNDFIKTFYVGYSNDGGVSWQRVHNSNGEQQIMPGLQNPTSGSKTTPLPELLNTTMIRIYPASYYSQIATYFDVIGNHNNDFSNNGTSDSCVNGSALCSTHLVTGLYGVDDTKITASQSIGGLFQTWFARYNASFGWIPSNTMMNGQYIQVDLVSSCYISCIVTQGNGHPSYVFYTRTFIVHYSSDGVNWITVKDQNGEIQTFIGNKDKSTPVINKLPTTITARYVRIEPKTYTGLKSLRFDLLGCWNNERAFAELSTEDCVYGTQPCGEYLVSGPEGVPDEQITASSFIDRFSSMEPWSARINSSTSWKAEPTGNHIQVDFGTSKLVTCIVTSGNKYGEYLITYYVKYSDDGVSWTYVVDSDNVRVTFPANNEEDPLYHQIRKLPSPISARYIMIFPMIYYNGMALRFDVIGCRRNDSETSPKLKTCEFENSTCQQYLMNTTSGNVVTTSSNLDNSKPDDGRIDSESAWSPDPSEGSPYIQVDLRNKSIITCIATRGSGNTTSHVRSYNIQYSTDGETWTKVTNDQGDVKLFPANNENVNDTVIQSLPEPIYTDRVRLFPYSYSGFIALRFDLLGCLNGSSLLGNSTTIDSSAISSTTIGYATTKQSETSVSETTATPIPVIVGESTAVPTTVIIGETTATQIPVTVGESTTTPTAVIVGESTTAPTAVIVGESTTTPTAVIVGESTTAPTAVVVGESTTTPTAVVVGESTTSPTTVIVDESTTTPTAVIVGESTTTQTAVIVGESTTAPNAVAVGESTTTPTAVVVGESTTAPTAVIVGESTTTPTAVVVGESTTTPTAMVVGESPTAPNAVVAGESTTTPTAVVVGESTTAPTAVIVGESTTTPTAVIVGEITTAPTAVIVGESTTTPTAVVVGESTTAPTPVIVGESTTTPTAMIVGESTTASTPVIVGETTTSSTHVIVGESTTTPTAVIVGESTTTPTPVVVGETTASQSFTIVAMTTVNVVSSQAPTISNSISATNSIMTTITSWPSVTSALPDLSSTAIQSASPGVTVVSTSNCICKCTVLNFTLTLDSSALKKKLSMFVKQLTILKNETALAKSKKVCASDDRQSSAVIGTFAAIMIISYIVFFAALDFIDMFKLFNFLNGNPKLYKI